MNDLKYVAGDVGNAFLTSYTTEKLYIIAGPEFGPELEGKRLIIEKSIYGTKMQRLGFMNLFLLNYAASNFDHHVQILIYGCDNSLMVVTITLLDTMMMLCASPRTQM